MTEAKVIGIDACEMVHIDQAINAYCECDNRELLSVTFFEENGHKYMLLVTKEKVDPYREILD